MINQLLPFGVSRDLIVDYLGRNGKRLLIICGVLLITAILPYKATLSQLQLLMLALVGVGAAVILLRWPALGLVALSVIGIVFPTMGPAGLNLSMMLVALLFGLWLIDGAVSGQGLRLVATRSNWPLLALSAVAIISFGIGQLPWLTFTRYARLDAQLGGLAIVLLSVAAFLLAGNQTSDMRWLKAMTWSFLAVSSFAVLLQLLPSSHGYLRLFFRGDFGAVFWICLVAFSFGLAFVNDDLAPHWRAALFGLGLISVYVVLVLRFAHKGGWVPSLVAVLTLIVLRWPRLGMVLLIFGGLAAAGFSSHVIESESYSLSTRVDAWLILGEMVKANPLFGLGFANYYWNTPSYAIRGWYVEFSSHNNYLDIVMQMGLVGLLCFLWFYWEVGRLGWRLRKRVESGFARAYVYASLAILVGMLTAATLGDWLLPFVYNRGLGTFRSSVLGWLFLGGLVCLKQIQSTKGAKAELKTEPKSQSYVSSLQDNGRTSARS